jgi:hypothetical protein
MLPGLLWIAFRFHSLLFKKEESIWVLAAGILLAGGFTFFIRRGVFQARFAVYGAGLFGIAVQLFGAVVERDFLLMGTALMALGVLILAGRALESRVGSAALNAGCHWYEGRPRLIPGVEVRVLQGGNSLRAGLRRIDEKGLFLFFEQPFSWIGDQKVPFVIAAGAITVEGEGQVVATCRGESQGMGLRFLPKDLGHFEKFTVLVQGLRGKGL